MTTTMGQEQQPVEEQQSSRPRKRSSARWREQLRRLLKLSEAQAVLGWTILTMLAALVGTIYLVQASSLAESGRRIQFLQFDLSDIKRENGELERQIAEAQALPNLQDRARSLGFYIAAPEEVEFIVVEEYPAVLPEPTPEPEIRPEPIDTIDVALWLYIRQSFTDLQRGEAVEQ